MPLLVKQALIMLVVIALAVVMARFILTRRNASQKTKTIVTSLIIGVPIFVVTLWALFPGFPYSI